jgi:Ni,Fe-hydrogenase III large subunit
MTTISTHAGTVIGIGTIPRIPIGEFREWVIREANGGGRLVALFGAPQDGDGIRLFAIVGAGGILSLTSAVVKNEYPSLTPDCPQARLFEREIAEQWGIRPEDHPWLKPVRFPRGNPGVAEFFKVGGEEVHEVAVGPVHAGIIEPGHFRFQCHGENVFHLEISLGYQHRGVERVLVGGPGSRTVYYMETLAGDTTIGHATAYCEALEALADCDVPPRAQALRGIAIELERLANHTGDLGAMANDVGYLPTASFCGRIRGDFLNMTALLCGSRFGRGLIRPGGVQFDIDDMRAGELRERLQKAGRDVEVAVNLLWSTPSVVARFEDAGVLSLETCKQLGLVGPAARACGMECDVRQEFPSGIFRFFHIPISTWHTGDVFARAYVRWQEIQRSLAFIEDLVKALPAGGIRAEVGLPAANSMVVSLAEGWRGEICHVAITDNHGRFARYKVIDPSFLNWSGLAMALRDGQISDFPLCNKSFNLSYCGHDL